MVNFENGVTPINDTNLNKLQTDLQDEIQEKGTYSTTEEKTVGTWIDGKPIYRKVFIVNGLTTSQRVADISLIANNLERAWLAGGFVYYSDNGTTYPLDSNIGVTVQVRNTSNSITAINDNGAGRTLDFYMFIEYTKTTD